METISQTKLDVLLKDLDEKIEMFRQQSDRHKRMHRYFRVGAFTFTALSSFLAGAALYAPEYQTTLNITLLAISALSGAVASIESMRKPDELWIHERTFYYSLSDLKRELTFESADGLCATEVDRFFKRFQTILENSGNKWSSDIAGSTETSEPLKTD